MSQQKTLNPYHGQLLYAEIQNQMMIATGAGWYTMYAVKEKPCLVCYKPHQIENNMIPDHPICDDNLKYLEWKNEQKEKAR